MTREDRKQSKFGYCEIKSQDRVLLWTCRCELPGNFQVDMYGKGVEIGVQEETYQPIDEAVSL